MEYISEPQLSRNLTNILNKEKKNLVNIDSPVLTEGTLFTWD